MPEDGKRASGLHLWLILWKAYETLREHAMRHIASLHLGFSDFAILELLLHKGPTAVNTIGNRVKLTSGSISVAIDRLEQKGLVERRNHPEDRRTRVVHLTEAGDGLIRCAFADHDAAMTRACAGLSAGERALAIALLKKLGLYAKDLLKNGLLKEDLLKA
jgi:MarR family transcriptional regulator, 2-MHQ and catechol-resistance regulon repressor